MTVMLVSERSMDTGSLAPATTERVATGAREWPDSCGKTQLAIHLATSLRDAGEVDVVIWVPATSRASVLSAYVEAAAALGLQATGDADALAARLLSWLHEAEQPWLVVFDDLREAATLDHLWPDGPAGRVLVTATSPAAAGRRAGREAVVIPVGPFSRRESLAYLMGRLTSDLDQRQGAADLVSELGDEPLALAMAAAAIASSEMTCRTYLSHLSARRERAAVADASPAALTWGLSVEHADLLAEAIAHAQLTIAAVLDGSGMPYSVFTTAGRQQGISDSTLDAGLNALEAAGLLSVDRSTSPPMVRVNWVIQAATRAATPDATLADMAAVAAGALLANWPAEDQPEWLARAFRSCTDSIRRLAGDILWRDGCPPLLMRAGQSLEAIPAPSAAVDYWSELGGTCDRLLGVDHPDTLKVSGRLASAYLAAGHPAEAIAWFQWVRGDRANRFGRDAQETADASRDLGLALLAAGRAAEAAAILTDAVTAYDHAAGPDSPQVLDTGDDLITAFRTSGKLSEAIRLGKLVHTSRQRVQGAQHPDTLASALLLARAHLGNGDAKAAVALLKNIVAEREKVLGARHADTIAARSALAEAYYGTGKMASAVQVYERVRAEYSQVLGADHRLTLTASLNLAHALYEVGRRTDATKLLQETARRCDLRLPADDPLTASARESLRNVTGSDVQETRSAAGPASPGPASASAAPAPPGAARAGWRSGAEQRGGDNRGGDNRRLTGRHRTTR
jgi:tetratricopeptide (TPR) repeat protein